MFSQLLGTRLRPHGLPATNTIESSSPLLRLPLEIRQLIFASLFKSSDSIAIVAARPSTPVEDEESSTSWPADQESFAIARHDLHSELLSTCQQVYAEGLPILYSFRNFDLTARESLKLFLHNVQPRTFTYIQHVTLDWDSLQDFAWSLPKPDYSFALSGLQTIQMATWRNRHIDTTSTRWRNVKGYERMICQAAADILYRHRKLCILAEEQFVRKGSVTQTTMKGYTIDENNRLREHVVDLNPKRVKWRFLSSKAELKDYEKVVDIKKDLISLMATQDEATDGGFHLPMIDPF